MSERPSGCLLFALPRALMGGSRPALGVGPALPAFDAQRFHRDDLPPLVRARRAAEACHATLTRTDHGLADAAVSSVATELVELTGKTWELGAALAEARAFLASHGPEPLAAERTRIELDMVGADAHRLVELKRAQAALERRAHHVGGVSDQVARLSARLETAAAELQELHARLATLMGSDALEEALRASRDRTAAAIDAFTATWEELGDDG